MKYENTDWRFGKKMFAACLSAAVFLFSAYGQASAQKGKGGAGPKYELVTLGFPQNFDIAEANDLNEQHQVIGTLNYRLNDERAAFWQFAEASAQPDVLPCPSEPCRSRANAINSLGTVVGFAGGTATKEGGIAAKWTRSGSGWELSAFPHPGDDAYFAEAFDILDNGSAAGMYAYLDAMLNTRSTPVLWDPAGTITELPVPQGFFAAEANRLNDSGDAVGTFLTFHSGSACCVLYGALWVNTPSGYVAFVFNELLTGITPRGPDGSFYMSAQTGRIRAFESGGSWNFAYEANPGPANGINDQGDIVGHIPKGYGVNGQPYLLFLSGTLVKLPVTKGSTGTASAVSDDAWVAGMLEKRPVVWRRVN